MNPKFPAAALLALLLSSCATQAVKQQPAVDAATAEQRQLARESALRAQDAWSLSGRIALSTGRNGGSGRIEWQQQDASYDVALSAPVTRQSWRLHVDAQGARLEGLEGGTRTGKDATALLRSATGWEIPVDSLRDWVRGLRAEGVAADVAYDGQGRLSRLMQDGWTIDYRWPDDGASAGVLPVRIDAAKGDAKVKLIVDEWQPRSFARGQGD